MQLGKRGSHTRTTISTRRQLEDYLAAAPVMIGLGRGASQVTAKVTVISGHDGKEVPLQKIVVDSESGKKLGALTSPFGSGSALSVAEGDVGDRKSTPQADAARMAKGLAQYLEKLVAASSAGPQSETASMLSPSLEP